MKYISLLLATAFIVQSASGLPIDGNEGWRHLINRHKCHLNILNQRDSKNSSAIYYSNLCKIEAELKAIDICNSEDVQGLIYFHDNMHSLLGLKENNSACTTEFELSTLRNELITAIQNKKLIYNIFQLKKKSITMAKYAGTAALLAATIYAYKNQTAIKEKASELASKALASDFASKVTEVGSQISTSVTTSQAYTKAAEGLKSAQQAISAQWANASNAAVNSQLYKLGTQKLTNASKQVSNGCSNAVEYLFGSDLGKFPLI